MAITEQVFIEFISDGTQLQPGVDKLIESGKVEKQVGEEFKKTNAEILKQQQALAGIGLITKQIDESGKVTKTNLRELAKIIKGQSSEFQKEIKGGIIDALKQAGVSVKQFEKLLDDSLDPEPVISLKTQLRSLVEQLAELKLQGKDTGQEYLDLANKAGKLRDAIGDANQQVKNFGSDTSTFDGLIQGVSGLAGGFAVVQGAAALFGDESEELQKTLLRVNAAMAILQGLQQIQVVLQKESAAAQLANTIATKAQAAALVVYNFVVGSSVGLMKAFRIALAATGIGLAILLIAELVEAFKSSNKELEDANKLIDRQKRLLEGLNEAIQRSTDLEVARLQAAGAAQNAIIAAQGKALLRQREGIVQAQKDLIKQRDELGRTSTAWHELNNQIDANGNLLKGLDNDLLVKNIEFQKQVVEDGLQGIIDLAQARSNAAKKNSAEDFASQKSLEIAKSKLAIEQAGQNAAKVSEIQTSLNKKLREIDRAAREQQQKDIIAGIENQLLQVQAKSKAINERTTQSEIDLQKKLIITKARFESQQEGLSQNQILAIKTKALEDANKLQKEFSKQTNKEILEDAISRNTAELQKIELDEKEKLSFKIDNIILAAQSEIESNAGLSEKIKEINAKRDRDIKEARLASIKATLEEELAISSADNAPVIRKLEKSLSDQQRLRSAATRFEEERLKKELGLKELSLNQELGMIDKITGISLDANFKRIAALNEERQKGLIGQKEYNLEYKRLVEEQTKIVEDGEKRKTDTTEQEVANRIAHSKKELENILLVADAVSNVFSSLNDMASDRENQRLDEARRNLKDLQDAGAITEKEAIARAKRLDAEERKIKTQQAQREKALALFNAIISTAKGVAAAIPNPFLIALAAAIGAAQIAIIAARPVPRFGKGKKNQYEGLAEVGETGPELVEKNGRMYLEEKSKIIWLSKKDKVFNPVETRAMMSSHQMNTERATAVNNTNNSIEINYDKIGEAVGKHVQTNVFVDGVHEQAIKKQLFEKYLDGKRTF